MFLLPSCIIKTLKCNFFLNLRSGEKNTCMPISSTTISTLCHLTLRTEQRSFRLGEGYDILVTWHTYMDFFLMAVFDFEKTIMSLLIEVVSHAPHSYFLYWPCPYPPPIHDEQLPNDTLFVWK